jgi:hypothetical protein
METNKKPSNPQEKILNKMHEVRDLIPSSDFPEDFNVLKKYNISNPL